MVDYAKEDRRRRYKQKSRALPWGCWVRKTQAPIWKRFKRWEENAPILDNMDTNDEVRDMLKGYRSDFYINSDYFKGNERVFELSFDCPWMMRDLYQFMVLFYKSLRGCDPVEKFKQFELQLGRLKDADGRRFNFTFLLPEDLRSGEEPIPENWEEIYLSYHTEEELAEVPFDVPEPEREPLPSLPVYTEEELREIEKEAEAMREADQFYRKLTVRTPDQFRRWAMGEKDAA